MGQLSKGEHGMTAGKDGARPLLESIEQARAALMKHSDFWDDFAADPISVLDKCAAYIAAPPDPASNARVDDFAARPLTAPEAFEFAQKYFPGGEAIVTIKRAAKVLMEWQRANALPRVDADKRT